MLLKLILTDVSKKPRSQASLANIPCLGNFPSFSEVFSGPSTHAPSVKPVPEPATPMFARPGSKEEPRRDLEAPRAPVFETALCKPRLQNGVKQGKDREGAIRRWLCVLAHSLEASETGELLQASSGDGADVLSQVLAGKATSTLIKRARTCGNLVKFACDRGRKFFPVRLDMFKMYLDELISAGRQSAARETLEAVNFAKHVLGVSVDPGLLDHPWVKGVARASRIQTKETKRSRVLTIGEVLYMENALIELGWRDFELAEFPFESAAGTCGRWAHIALGQGHHFVVDEQSRLLGGVKTRACSPFSG